MNQSQDMFESLLHEAYRYAIALTNSEAEAEDLVQEACLAILKARGPWTRAYLFTAVRSRFIDVGRLRTSRPIFGPTPNGESTPVTTRLTVYSETETSDELSALSDALARLKPEEREVLYLSGVLNLSVRHIARHVGRSRGSMLSLLSRSRKKLIRLMSTKQIEVRS